MSSIPAQIDALLSRDRGRHIAQAMTWRRTLGILIAFGLLYGAIMGTFGGVGPERFEQIVYSAVKVPILLLASFSICVPSFFVINTIVGVRDDFGEALRALLLSQAALAVILASLSPYTALWYLSFESYRGAILFNGGMFAAASVAAQFVLRRLYRPLIERQPRHRALMWLWLVMYVFVGIQMAWVLRPYIGSPEMPTQFFREDSWSNAYVFITRMIWEVIAG